MRGHRGEWGALCRGAIIADDSGDSSTAPEIMIFHYPLDTGVSAEQYCCMISNVIR